MGGGVPLEKIRPKWAEAVADTFVEAVKSNKVVVLHFVRADNDRPDDVIFSIGLNERSSDKATFVHVRPDNVPVKKEEPAGAAPPVPVAKPKPAEIVPTSKVVPQSKLESKDLWKAFNVDATKGGNTFVLTDAFGNEYKRWAQIPKHKDLERMIDQVPTLVEQRSKKLEGEFAKAKAEAEKGRDDKALKHLFTLFKDGFVGQKPLPDAVELYDSILEKGRDKLDDAITHDDVKAIEPLRKLYKGTDLESEIEEAAKAIAKATTSK